MHKRHQRRRLPLTIVKSSSQNVYFDKALQDAVLSILTQNQEFFRDCELAITETPFVDTQTEQVSLSSSFIDPKTGIRRIVLYSFPILAKVGKTPNLYLFLADLIQAQRNNQRFGK